MWRWLVDGLMTLAIDTAIHCGPHPIDADQVEQTEAMPELLGHWRSPTMPLGGK